LAPNNHILHSKQSFATVKVYKTNFSFFKKTILSVLIAFVFFFFLVFAFFCLFFLTLFPLKKEKKRTKINETKARTQKEKFKKPKNSLFCFSKKKFFFVLQI
jgi:predicted membrane protein